MVKTGQFTTKCKGDKVIALKRQKLLWWDSTYNVKHALTSEVMSKFILAVNVTVSHNKWIFTIF